MKFECKKCGKCCKEIKSLFLFEWEADRLKEIAKKKNIKLNMELGPFSEGKFFLFDEKTGIVFSFCSILHNSPCPFLEKNLCSIYDESPLMCRSSPLLNTPYDNLKKFGEFIYCYHFEHNKFIELFVKKGETKMIDRALLAKKLNEVYGKCYDYCRIFGIIGSIWKNYIGILNQEGKIKIKLLNKKEAKKHKMMPFFKFLKEAGIKNEEEIKEMINYFSDYENRIKEISSND